MIVASHLLGEIERVCNYLVAIEGGQLLRSAPLGAFTERTGTLAVEVEDGSDALAERLAAAGLSTRRRRPGRPDRPRRRAAVRPRPRHGRGPRPAARPDRAAAAPARGPVPRRAGGAPPPLRRTSGALRRRPRPARQPGRRHDGTPLPGDSPTGSIYDLGYRRLRGAPARSRASRSGRCSRTASGRRTASAAAAGRRSPRSSSVARDPARGRRSSSCSTLVARFGGRSASSTARLADPLRHTTRS